MKGIIMMIGGSIGIVASAIIAGKGFLMTCFEKHEIGDLIDEAKDSAEEVF